MWLYNMFYMPGMGTCGSEKSFEKLADWENAEQHQELFVFITNVFLNLFEWSNLPPTCNSRVLEQTLFFYGKCLFFRDDEIFSKTEGPVIGTGEGKYWHTPVTLHDGRNIYNEPTGFTAYSYDYNKEYNINNSVLIRNNVSLYPSFPTVRIYVEKLLNAARSIDVVTENIKTPYVMVVDETNKLSAEAFIKKKRNNQEAIFISKGVDPDTIKVFPTSTSAHNTLTDVWEHKHNLENELRSRLGIDNAHTDKRERLIEAEVSANDLWQEISIDTLLAPRKRACELINEMFGLNVSCELKFSAPPVVEEPGGEENE